MPKHLRRKELAVLTSWLSEARPTLELDAWDIWLSGTPCSDAENDAENEIGLEADVCTISLGEGWRDYPEDVLRHALTHELCHLYVQRAWSAADQAVGMVDGAAGELLAEQLRLEFERAVDRMARAFAALLPPIVLP